METRETFAGLSDWQIALWYTLIVVSTSIFALGVGRLVLKYLHGRGRFPADRLPHRIARTVRIVFTHTWIKRRDGVAGLAHAMIFYGFLVLFIGTGILAFQDDFAKPVLGWDFWHGPFYLGYSLFLDVFGAVLIVGLVILAVKRARKPKRLDYTRVDGSRASTHGGATRLATGSSSARSSSSASPASCSRLCGSPRPTHPSRGGRRSAGSWARV